MSGDDAGDNRAISSFVRRHEAFQAALKHRCEEIVDRSKGRDSPTYRDQEELDFLAESLQPCFDAMTNAWNELMDSLGRDN